MPGSPRSFRTRGLRLSLKTLKTRARIDLGDILHALPAWAGTPLQPCSSALSHSRITLRTSPSPISVIRRTRAAGATTLAFSVGRHRSPSIAMAFATRTLLRSSRKVAQVCTKCCACDARLSRTERSCAQGGHARPTKDAARRDCARDQQVPYAQKASMRRLQCSGSARTRETTTVSKLAAQLARERGRASSRMALGN